jgi:transcriptional regulator with XRE-family HTH domain
MKKRRMQLRISQTALGASIGVSFQQVQKYERGTNRVSASTLYSLAKALDVPITFFFDEIAPRQDERNAELTQKAAVREEFVATDEGQRLVDAFLTMPRSMRPKFISLLATFSAST